jgi:hypothetical protein
VTDAGISALSAGCGQLQSIYLDRCDKVTDAVDHLLVLFFFVDFAKRCCHSR